MKKLLTIAALLLALICHAEDYNYGGWNFVEVNHNFGGKFNLTGYFETDNLGYRRFDCLYFRVLAGYKLLPWLKIGVNYVPVCEAGGEWLHYGEAELVGTLRSGNFKVSIRERYRHGFTNDKNELRSRLKVIYSFPESRFGVYLAPEVFTWGSEWLKARHYAGGTFDVLPWMQLDAYYMYYAFKSSPAEHVFGFGLNFDI